MTIDKVGLFLKRGTSFLVVRQFGTSKFLMPGGRREDRESDIDTLSREIREELNVKLNKEIYFLGEFIDKAANDPGDFVKISLYDGQIDGEPIPSSEIEEIKWFDVYNDSKEILSDIVKNKILPSIQMKFLKKCPTNGCT